MKEDVLSVLFAQSLPLWVLAFARMLPLALASPLLGAGLLPWPFRLAAAAVFGLAIAPAGSMAEFANASAFFSALLLELFVGGVFALGVGVIFSAVRGALSLVETHHSPKGGPLERIYLAAFLAVLAGSGGLELVVAALGRTYAIIAPASAWNSAVPLATGQGGSVIVGQIAAFFSLTLLMALPVLAVRMILDMAVLILSRTAPSVDGGAVGRVIGSHVMLLFVATTMLAVLGLAVDQLSRI